MTFLRTLTVGDLDLQCHFTADPGEPSQTSGPPERCYEGTPPSFELQRVELDHEITEDLGPAPASKRTVVIDLTAMLLDLGDAWAVIEDRLAKVIDYGELFSDDRDGPEDWED